MLQRRENWEGSGSSIQASRISAHRYGLGVDVGILSEHGQMRGSVENMSVSGARIEGAGIQPPKGESLKLGFCLHVEALPVPIRATVVRHTDSGGFAVEFENVDFRTQLLLRALLPRVSGEDSSVDVESGMNDSRLDMNLDPELHAACARKAEESGMSLCSWILEQLRRATTEPH